LTELTVREAVAAMQSGDMSAEDYATALLSQTDQHHGLNVFITLDPQRVLAAARAADERRRSGVDLGPLHGLPIPVKDSVNTKGYPTTGGTKALAGFYPREDAELVRRLVAAGAIVMGKTNMHELSFGWTSNNLAFGAVHNPYDPTRIAGGSSGGTAAAVAACMAPLGVAEDTTGSIRVPAALCGVVGFRPTKNRYPNQGVIPITPLFDQVGPHARSVADISLFDQVITGESPAEFPRSLEGVRLGVARAYYFESLDAEVERITESALGKLAEAGAILVEADVPGLARLIGHTTSQIELYHVMPMLERFLVQFDTGVTFDELMARASRDIRDVFAEYVLPGGASTIPEADFVAARDRYRAELVSTMQEYFVTHKLAAMVFPPTQIAAPPIGHDTETLLNGEIVPFEPVISRNIMPGSGSGLPGLVVPSALNRDGLPVGLEFDAPVGRDRELLSLGQAIETVLGRLPPPHSRPAI
jgi:mandelamide amidase